MERAVNRSRWIPEHCMPKHIEEDGPRDTIAGPPSSSPNVLYPQGRIWAICPGVIRISAQKERVPELLWRVESINVSSGCARMRHPITTHILMCRTPTRNISKKPNSSVFSIIPLKFYHNNSNPLNCTIQQYNNMRISFCPSVSVSAFLSVHIIAAPRKFSRKPNPVSIFVQISPCFMIVKDQTTGFSNGVNGVTPNLAISSTGNNDEERHFLFRRPLYG
jgi:hypothetical protein